MRTLLLSGYGISVDGGRLHVKDSRDYNKEPKEYVFKPEFIWKGIKRVVSRMFIVNLDLLKSLIEEHFMRYSSKLSFAAGWIERFIKGEYKCILFGS